jgi:nitrate reductase NapAB chaperone NapD
METLIIHSEPEKLTAIKSFLEEMNITFEVKKKKVKKKIVLMILSL